MRVSVFQQNRAELRLILEDLKARERREQDAARKAELQSQLGTWSQMYQVAGGDPDRVAPASTANDFRLALARNGFPALDPERYLPQERQIAEIRDYRTAASDLPGPDRDVLGRREANLQACLATRKKADRLSSVGVCLAQLSWMAAVPAYLAAGPAGLVGCAGALVGGVGLILGANQMHGSIQSDFMRRTPSEDLATIVKWQEHGPRLVEEFLQRQAERYNASWLEKAVRPDPSAIRETEGAVMVGGVRLKTRPSREPGP